MPLIKRSNYRAKIESDGSKYAFPDIDGNPIKKLRTAFENVCSRANIKGLRFHDLRHTAATRMIEDGANIIAVSRILGHSTLSMTMKYIHLEDSLREVLENLAKDRSNENTEQPKLGVST